MSFAAVRATVETHIASNWTMTKVEFENAPLNTENLDEYISINIMDSEGVQASLGDSGQYQVSGVILAMVLTKRDIGTGRARVISDAVASLFRAAKIDNVMCRVPKGYRVRSDSDYYQFNVAIPFYAYFNL
jgi:hypothetical protein